MTMIDHGGHDPLTGIDAIRVSGRREADTLDTSLGAGIALDAPAPREREGLPRVPLAARLDRRRRIDARQRR